MKKIWIIIAVALVVTACQETLEERCEREAKEYTEKHCPTPIAKDIVMDSMTFDKATHTITYAYTLSGQLDDSAVVNGSNSRELLLQEVKNSTAIASDISIIHKRKKERSCWMLRSVKRTIGNNNR